MTDHDKLRGIVRQAHAFIDGARIGSMERYLTASDLLLLADAAESTLPKTKMVEVWRVEWAGAGNSIPMIEQFGALLEAEDFANGRRVAGRKCIRVTGPHQQEVPA